MLISCDAPRKACEPTRCSHRTTCSGSSRADQQHSPKPPALQHQSWPGHWQCTCHCVQSQDRGVPHVAVLAEHQTTESRVQLTFLGLKGTCLPLPALCRRCPQTRCAPSSSSDRCCVGMSVGCTLEPASRGDPGMHLHFVHNMSAKWRLFRQTTLIHSARMLGTAFASKHSDAGFMTVAVTHHNSLSGWV